MNSTYSYCPSCHTVNKINSDKALSSHPVCGKCSGQLPLHALVSSVNEEGFQKIINKCDQYVIVDFWASWCGPCQVYGPVFEAVSKEVTDNITFLKVNTEQSPNLSLNYGIRGIPCTIILKNGKEIARQSGALNKDQLTHFIKSNI